MLTDLKETIEKFWSVEEISDKKSFSSEELECEAHFTCHVNRDAYGRYVVALPFKPDFKLSRGSKKIALNSLHQLHKRFEKNYNYKIQYTAIIREYLDLSHMSLLESTIPNDGIYLPYLGVFKNSSSTTKLRVVFNPSIADKESLNSQLMVGATIQDDLFSLIIRFRFYTFVIIGDI